MIRGIAFSAPTKFAVDCASERPMPIDPSSDIHRDLPRRIDRPFEDLDSRGWSCDQSASGAGYVRGEPQTRSLPRGFDHRPKGIDIRIPGKILGMRPLRRDGLASSHHLLPAWVPPMGSSCNFQAGSDMPPPPCFSIDLDPTSFPGRFPSHPTITPSTSSFPVGPMDPCACILPVRKTRAARLRSFEDDVERDDISKGKKKKTSRNVAAYHRW